MHAHANLFIVLAHRTDLGEPLVSLLLVPQRLDRHTVEASDDAVNVIPDL